MYNTHTHTHTHKHTHTHIYIYMYIRDVQGNGKCGILPFLPWDSLENGY